MLSATLPMTLQLAVFSVLLSRELFLSIQAFQPGIPFHLQDIARAARVLQVASFQTSADRVRAELTRRNWFHAHGIRGLELLYQNCPDITCDGSFLAFAASVGHVEAVRYLLQHHPTHHGPAILQATQHGHFDVLELFHNIESTDGFTSYVMNLAAARGFLNIVRFLHDNRKEGCTHQAMDNAAKNGHLDIVKFLHAHRTEGCTTDAMDDAASSGHLDVVQFLHEKRTEGCTQKAMDGAVCGGHDSVFHFLHTHRSEGCSKKAMDAAAARGDFKLVQFLHWNRHEGCTIDALRTAAEHGHANVVEYLLRFRNEGCVKESIALGAAAGHVQVVQCILRFAMPCSKDHDCPPEFHGMSLLRVARRIARAHKQTFVLKVLNDLKPTWRDRRDVVKQKVVNVWKRVAFRARAIGLPSQS
ncbi:unnamed protein product [Aphanomyces euteiches]|uniref:Uncharacterized protein n=1 Tax=Aphanomyces euteiches TaxID=100861 RepID=A0A6G0X5Y6_9STRA|nr:hypothetical protein Ae201684_008198 [Aphanomyces euteiches]KAH9070267.1 hypothetical protein Ae201684P_002632 [Aphanomyces euteiches]KAH9138462.1 hypothetical protein AeRB84_017246 [Aphanomyces euteiches]